MGTRHLTHVMDGDQTLLTLFGMYDGQPDGYGAQLKEFLANSRIENFQLAGDPKPTFYGARHLAAMLVAHFADADASFLIYPAGGKNCGEAYTYWIFVHPHRTYLKLRVWDWVHDRCVFDGLLDLFDPEQFAEATEQARQSQ